MSSPAEFFRRPPKKIIVAAVPGIGDVLLATPLIHSLKLAFPDAKIDALVLEGCQGILEGNPDIEEVLTFSRTKGTVRKIPIYWRLLRKYDAAISTSISDRIQIYQLFASGRRASLLPPRSIASMWKYLFATVAIELDSTIPTVQSNVRFAEQLGVKGQYTVVPPQAASGAPTAFELLGIPAPDEGYAVVHPVPGGTYKLWTSRAWVEIFQFFASRNLSCIVTGGPGEAALEEIMLLAEQSGLSLINAAGKLPFTAVADLLRGAEIFVGTDTSTTHLAACVGAPTVALFGPTPPKTWGPWPVAWKKDEAPFQNIYGTQRAGNVSIVRHECRCQPFRRSCKLLDNGLSTCMLDLTPATVIAELEQRLGTNLSRKQKVI